MPHSEIHGSRPARGSPWLIATCCVLHRLSVPRHPPDALQTLDLIGAYSSTDRRSDDRVSRHLRMRHAQEKAHIRTRHQPATASGKDASHDPTDCLPTAEATALSGHPRSLILFTCQRSHTRLSGYLLSLSRISVMPGHRRSLFVTVLPPGGGGRDRTDDLMLAKHALSQLSYAPTGKDQENSGGPGKT